MSSPLLRPADYPEPRFPPDPDFPRASSWLAADTKGQPIARIVGAPFSELSISGARCDLLPQAIRKALLSFSTFSPTLEVDLADFDAEDVGDVDLEEVKGEEALARIAEACGELRGEVPVLVLGGDNSVTQPALEGLTDVEQAGLITLDAHHDLRDYQRDGLSNGSPVRVLLDHGLQGGRIWQIGIKDFANSREYDRVAREAGIEVVALPEVREQGVGGFVEQALGALSPGPIYVDLDVDVVDRALAPGAPAAQPGGLHPSQLAYAAFLAGSHPAVVAADIVEVDPTRDSGDTTARLCALVALSFLAGVARRPR